MENIDKEIREVRFLYCTERRRKLLKREKRTLYKARKEAVTEKEKILTQKEE
jgi:hypothetical protein